jgi:hypothetical protein
VQLAATSAAIAVRLEGVPSRPVGGRHRLVVVYTAPNVPPRMLAVELRKLAAQLDSRPAAPQAEE